MKAKTRLVRKPDGWWIEGFECGPVGPYKTKNSDELRGDRKGLIRFYQGQSLSAITKVRRPKG